MRLAKRLANSEQGIVTTELAFILPVLLLLIMGIMEVGHVLNAWVVMTNETREAARYAVAGVRDGDSNLTTEVSTYMDNRLPAQFSASQLTITTTVVPAGANAGTVTVQASYPVPLATPLMQRIMGSITVRAEAVMRAE